MSSIVIKDLSKSSELDQHAKAKVLGGAPREESGLYLNPDKDIFYLVGLPTDDFTDLYDMHSDDSKTTSGYGAANTANMGAIYGGSR